jgi:hypothetical protein
MDRFKKMNMKDFVGSYILGEESFPDGTKYIANAIGLHKKPNLVKRFCMKHLLGFVWRNVK